MYPILAWGTLNSINKYIKYDRTFFETKNSNEVLEEINFDFLIHN